jgi:hypothetical protein
MQILVARHADVLNAAIGVGPIEWRSPLEADDFAEYRDGEFLQRIDIELPSVSLTSFWPLRGPQWDALGRSQSGAAVLVEAKAHIPELFSPACQAREASLATIRLAMQRTAAALGAKPGLDWTRRFYQYTNRLAHGYLLSTLNQVPTELVFLSIVGDRDMNGPETCEGWEAAYLTVEEAIGLRGRMPKYVRHAYVDVSGEVPVAVCVR